MDSKPRQSRGDVVRRSVDLPRPVKRFITICTDTLMTAAALWAALSLKAGTAVFNLADWPAYLAAIAVSTPIFIRMGLYRAVIRFLGHKAAFAVAAAVLLSGIVLETVGAVLRIPALSASVVVIYSCLLLLYVAGSRLTVRHYLLTHYIQPTVARVAIYGAGDAGARLATALSTTRAFDPMIFIDDKKSLHGRMINGIKVHAPEDLPILIKDRGIDRILLAMPSLTRRRRREILSQLEPLGVHVQTVPEIEQLVTGTAHVGDIREVDVSDLLGRDSVPPKANLFDACIRDRVVMVTGAGGSIGSELCRQIIGLGPRRLVLFEMSELALYNIQRELQSCAAQRALNVDLVGLIGNAHHKYRLRDILQAYRVQTVYHAAAYKHVPIVEQNVIEGIHNNVIATWYAAEAAHETDVETFVLVSTDKAVNPTNVMGATKRFAEIVLQGLQRRGSKTRFCMVRFGNVLASSGSVVPLFNEQIKAGGPVTVTHPEVIRYFMTIPEAAQLVIQAGSMADGGDVFVLDMGKPVRIGDLARRMINLMGLTVRDEQHPDGDIEISYTGLRPAEKLYEELLIGNNVTGTEHPMILRAIEHSLPWERVQSHLEEILVAMSRFDCHRALNLLGEVVEEYRPAPESHDLVWARQSALAADDRKVTSLKPRRIVRNTGPTDTAHP
ncbi:MAG TPA: nucleoside-diphosphate sugar epimerase/dehydratase [Steroidobacteraceae bacterium]|nr:nucleoside-diphosphate sugar epimerase/dehydratase [Steroidobacteraceae bacterium]